MLVKDQFIKYEYYKQCSQCLVYIVMTVKSFGHVAMKYVITFILYYMLELEAQGD